MDAVDRLIADALAGRPRWPADADAATFLDRAHVHGVSGLLHAALEAAPSGGVPPEVRGELRERALRAAAVELGRRHELVALLEAMARAGVQALLIKGTPLAYTTYPEASLRERADTDLLVLPSQRAALYEVLQARGYRRSEATGAELASSEATFWKDEASPTLDVHWRISNSPLLAGALDFESLAIRAVAVPALGPHARAPGPEDAVLLASLHRAAHHPSPFYTGDRAHYGDRLVWLYDLHLLTPALTDAQCRSLARDAERHRVAGLCLDALHATQEAFGTPLPPALVEALERAATAPEPSMVLLRGGRRRVLLAELRAVRGWAERARWLREHVLPPADYMLRKYDTRRRWLLPALYVRRALGWLSRA